MKVDTKEFLVPINLTDEPRRLAAFLRSDEKLERNHRGRGKRDGARLENHQTRREGGRKMMNGKVLTEKRREEEEKVEGERGKKIEGMM